MKDVEVAPTQEEGDDERRAGAHRERELPARDARQAGERSPCGGAECQDQPRHDREQGRRRDRDHERPQGRAPRAFRQGVHRLERSAISGGIQSTPD